MTALCILPLTLAGVRWGGAYFVSVFMMVAVGGLSSVAFQCTSPSRGLFLSGCSDG